jgi:hypothetical protein
MFKISNLLSLKDLTGLQKGLRVIGDGNFSWLIMMGKLTIPDGVTYIGKSCFMSCFGLDKIHLPNSLTYIGESAFYNCSGLKC